MKKLFLPLGLLTLSLMACYSPDAYESESLDDGSTSNADSEIGTLFSLNGGSQTCNPSVSQDTVNFPASMLWLNFGGDLSVVSSDSEYTTSKKYVEQHDRLTVSDTANKVKWFLMRDLSKGECQFQDPEWSTHPDYIVALRGYDVKGSKSCTYLDFGIFAVRTSDKAKFWFFDKNINEDATPHVWVEPSAKADEDGDISTVEGFFGTENVRLTYVNDEYDIVFADFANGGLKKAKKLKKPKNRTSGWKIDSPLISPDGHFVVYNMTEGYSVWEAYIQELSENSTPVLIEQTKDMTSAPAQPHWFEYDGRLYVIWTEFPAGKPMLNTIDLQASTAQDGSAGRTMMREVRLTPGAASRDLAVEWLGETRVIATIPMTGGRSPDAKFLATGTNPAYLLQLP